MGKALEWEPVPEGLDVYWEGLEFQRIEPLSPTEVRDAGLSFFRQFMRVGFLLTAVTTSIVLALVILRPRKLVFALIGVAVLVILGLMFGALGLLIRPNYLNKAVFRGTEEDLESSPHLKRALKRARVCSGEVVAEVLSDGFLWSLNGQPVRWLRLIAMPVFLAKPCLVGLPGQLSAAERLELKMNSSRICKTSDGIAVAAFGFLGHSSFNLFQSSPFWFRFGYVGLMLLAATGVGLWNARLHRLLNRDVEDGVLELVGDRQLLKHSRKPWSVDGRPAEWRRTEVRKSRSVGRR